MNGRVIASNLVNVFKAAWERADSEGRAGARTSSGIAAVLEELLLAEGDIVVGQPSSMQSVTLWVGDSLPIQVEDFATATDLQDWAANPILRAVAIARLRTIADLLEQPMGNDE